MKKKLITLLAGLCAVSMLAGCSSTGGKLSNDNVTISQYKGLEVEKVSATEVTDDMVESQISSNLQGKATTEEITDRAVESGDTAVIDYTGKIDGTEFDGGSAKDYSLLIGSGSFIGANGDSKGFEEQIIGHNIGETFDITVQFPDDYTNTDYAGKKAVFTITIKSISISTAPELTDKWVKENSEESKTVAEYKKEVKKELEKNYEDSTKESLKSEVIDALLEKTEVKKYPEDDVKSQVDEMTDYYKSMAESYGMEYTDFLNQYLGMTEDDFTTQVKTAAQDTVKKNLACQLIADKKKLNLSDKEYKAEYKTLAENYGYESTDDLIDQVGEDTLKQIVLQDKVADYLVESCVQVEATETTDEQTTTDTTTDSSSDSESTTDTENTTESAE
ncbi:trigger factor [Hespellia stercorisuis]|uniref:peptidylprolyl isomerase n=1 Tax=Hespellia stercorisuis DSM 15480 TaxID=1121950 RepID=A0A1M6QJE3_9FIRM|nr:trigger factor [Hespellia stercorisuis]SHK20414.1 trigger factor [Hespellia stercorisuis DSM 15480]